MLPGNDSACRLVVDGDAVGCHQARLQCLGGVQVDVARDSACAENAGGSAADSKISPFSKIPRTFTSLTRIGTMLGSRAASFQAFI